MDRDQRMDGVQKACQTWRAFAGVLLSFWLDWCFLISITRGQVGTLDWSQRNPLGCVAGLVKMVRWRGTTRKMQGKMFLICSFMNNLQPASYARCRTVLRCCLESLRHRLSFCVSFCSWLTSWSSAPETDKCYDSEKEFNLATNQVVSTLVRCLYQDIRRSFA